MRADARENRDRVLVAAEQVFTELGLDASTEVVARRAGVGVGTVFRHFSTKRELVEGVLLAQFHEVTQRALAVESDIDATASLLGFVEELADRIATKLALSGYLFGGGGWSGPAEEASRELQAVIERLLRRAQDAGGVRADIGTDELYFLIRGLAQPCATGSGADSGRRLAVRVVLDGLRIDYQAPVQARG